MPAEPAPVDQPEHPLHALTTSELRDYRARLESALACCRPRCLHMGRQQSLLMKRQRSVSLYPRPAAPGAGACP